MHPCYSSVYYWAKHKETYRADAIYYAWVLFNSFIDKLNMSINKYSNVLRLFRDLKFPHFVENRNNIDSGGYLGGCMNTQNVISSQRRILNRELQVCCHAQKITCHRTIRTYSYFCKSFTLR